MAASIGVVICGQLLHRIPHCDVTPFQQWWWAHWPLLSSLSFKMSGNIAKPDSSSAMPTDTSCRFYLPQRSRASERHQHDLGLCAAACIAISKFCLNCVVDANVLSRSLERIHRPGGARHHLRFGHPRRRSSRRDEPVPHQHKYVVVPIRTRHTTSSAIRRSVLCWILAVYCIVLLYLYQIHVKYLTSKIVWLSSCF